MREHFTLDSFIGMEAYRVIPSHRMAKVISAISRAVTGALSASIPHNAHFDAPLLIKKLLDSCYTCPTNDYGH